MVTLSLLLGLCLELLAARVTFWSPFTRVPWLTRRILVHLSWPMKPDENHAIVRIVPYLQPQGIAPKIRKGKNRQQLRRAGCTLGNGSLDCVDQAPERVPTSKDESVRKTDRRYNKRSEESEEEIPEPVTRSCKCSLFRSSASGEHLSDEDPDAATVISYSSAVISEVDSRSPCSREPQDK
jgi:hypothetical protein